MVKPYISITKVKGRSLYRIMNNIGHVVYFSYNGKDAFEYFRNNYNSLT